MSTVKLLMIEGMDRAGKDTLAHEFEKQTNAKNVKFNVFDRIGENTYYDVNRLMLGSPKSPYFKSRIGEAMAISEHMQTLSHIVDYPNRRAFVMARSFVSTTVYDWVRGIVRTGLGDIIYEMNQIFQDKHDTRLDIRLLKLYVSREEQLARGSSEDSFEQVYYNSIKACFDQYNNTLIFDRIRTIDTTEKSQSEVYVEAESFLFTS